MPGNLRFVQERRWLTSAMMHCGCSVSLTRCHAGFKGAQRSAGVQGSGYEVDVQEEKQRPAMVPGDQGLDDSDHGGHYQHVAATASMQRHKSFVKELHYLCSSTFSFTFIRYFRAETSCRGPAHLLRARMFRGAFNDTSFLVECTATLASWQLFHLKSCVHCHRWRMCALCVTSHKSPGVSTGSSCFVECLEPRSPSQQLLASHTRPFL